MNKQNDIFVTIDKWFMFISTLVLLVSLTTFACGLPVYLMQHNSNPSFLLYICILCLILVIPIMKMYMYWIDESSKVRQILLEGLWNRVVYIYQSETVRKTFENSRISKLEKAYKRQERINKITEWSERYSQFKKPEIKQVSLFDYSEKDNISEVDKQR